MSEKSKLLVGIDDLTEYLLYNIDRGTFEIPSTVVKNIIKSRNEVDKIIEKIKDEDSNL